MAAHPPVSNNCLPCDIPGIFTGQECYYSGNVFRFAGIWQRIMLHELFPLLLGKIPKGCRGKDQSGSNGIASVTLSKAKNNDI